MSNHLSLSFFTLPHSVIIAGVVGLFSASIAGIVGASPLLGLVVATGLLGVVTAFTAPVILLFGLLIVRMSIDATDAYFTIPLSKTLSLNPSQMMGVAVAVLAVVIIIRERKHIARTPLVGVFALLIVWALGSITISVSPTPLTTTLYEVLRMLTIFTIYILAITTITTHNSFEKLLRVLLIGSVIPLGAALIQFLTGSGYTDIVFDVPRVYGTFAHPNIFSTYLVAMVAVGALLLRITPSRTARQWARIAIALYVMTILLTFARVAWIALAVFSLVVAATRFTRLLPLMVITPLVLYATVPAFHARVTEALHPSVDSSITWRLGLWDDTIQRTLDDGRAHYGNGIGTFSVVAESVRGNRFGSTDPHNEYVRAFVEGGWIGLGIFAAFTVWVIGTLAHVAWHTRGTEASDIFLILFALAAALAVASLSDHIFRSTPLQWIFFALIGGAHATYYRHNTAPGTRIAR